MSIQDLHDLTPLPQVDPLTLGVSPAPMAPPPLPPAPQMGQPVQANPSQRILSLAALASMIAGGRATSGLGSGILQGQQRMENERQQREAVAINERRYLEQQAQQQQIQFQREQAQWQQTLQARQQTLMKAVGDIRQQVSKLPNKGAYDQQIEGFANLLRSSGYRVDGNWLRQAAPYMEPSAQDRASKALDDVLANPMTQAAMKVDPSRVLGGKVMFDANGDGTPEAVSFQELAAMAGRPMVADDQGQPLIPTAEEGKPGTPFQEVLKSALTRFRAENKRDPNPQEKQAIVASSVRLSKENEPDPTLQAIRALTLKGLQNGPALPDRVMRRVESKSKAFDSQPAVKRTQTMAEAVSFADGLNPHTQNPADDQALIYAFAKAMDPDSVVREGEYATVQKYGQSWAEMFGFNAARIFSNTVFLTPQARSNMKATIRARYQAARAQYDNLASAYAKQIDGITGQPGTGKDYLVDYAGAFPDAKAPAGASPAGAPSYEEYLSRKGMR